MMTPAIYVRVSTTCQAEADLSLSDQVAQCRRYCEQRGWEVVETFTEPGASAFDDDRPAFQEMICKAMRAERPLDFVVVHSLSRFSRYSLHSEFYIRRLRKAGVELVSVTQDLGQDSGGGPHRPNGSSSRCQQSLMSGPSTLCRACSRAVTRSVSLHASSTDPRSLPASPAVAIAVPVSCSTQARALSLLPLRPKDARGRNGLRGTAHPHGSAR